MNFWHLFQQNLFHRLVCLPNSLFRLLILRISTRCYLSFQSISFSTYLFVALASLHHLCHGTCFHCTSTSVFDKTEPTTLLNDHSTLTHATHNTDQDRYRCTRCTQWSHGVLAAHAEAGLHLHDVVQRTDLGCRWYGRHS